MTLYFETDLGRLYHGDCLEIMPHLEPVDLVLTDPPYGVDIAPWDIAPNNEFLDLCKSICSGTIIMFSGASMRSMSEFIKLNPDRMLIWAPAFTLSHLCTNGMAWRYHPIWCWNLPQKQEAVKWDILTDNTECGNWWKHSCTKPISLIMLLARMTGGAVLDPFLGSGTTAVACERLNRRWIGIEIEEEYCEIAAKRIEQENKQLKLFR